VTAPFAAAATTAAVVAARPGRYARRDSETENSRSGSV
jgi:hypothetical protein